MTAGLLIVLPFSPLRSQEAAPASSSDTLQPTIPIENIPTASGETSLLILRESEALISPGQIALEKVENDSLLALVDSLLAQERSIDLQILDGRSLNNKRSLWRGYQKKTKSQIDQLRGFLDNLGGTKTRIEEEAVLWRNTLENIDTSVVDSVTLETIEGIILLSDSINQTIVTRTNEVLSLQNQLTAYDVEINDLIERINTLLIQREGEILSKTHPSLFELDYSSPDQWWAGEYLQLFFEEERGVLETYYQNNQRAFISFLGFLLLLLGFFFYLKNRVKEIIPENPTISQYGLKRILSRPASVALTLGIFSAGLFFKNQPPIIVDLTIIILVIPLLDIGFHISKKRGYPYLAVFGVLSLLRFLNDILPPEMLLHRFILLVAAGLEVIFLYRLIRLMRTEAFSSKLLQQFILLLINFHLIAAFIGLAANLLGYLNLADTAIDTAINNTLVGLLLVISATTLIGLIQLGIDGRLFGQLNFVRNRSKQLKSQTVKVIMFLATLVWLDAIIRTLGIGKNFYTWMGDVLSREISLGDISFTLGKVLLFFLVIWLSIIISRFIRYVLEDDVLSRMTLKKGVPRMISSVITYALITIGVLLAVNAVGIPLNQLTIIFSAFSVGIGFGLQNVVNNFVSGIILLFERPVQIGDTVEVGGLIGTVSSMGIRSSHIRTFDGAEVIVPNGHLISNEVTNWTLNDKRRRIEIIAGVAYGSDVHKVQELLLDIINQHPDIIKIPKPIVLFNNMSESSLDFRMLFWTDKFDDWIRIRSEVIFLVHDTLYREGISIPFPQRDLHIKTVDGLGPNLRFEKKE